MMLLAFVTFIAADAAGHWFEPAHDLIEGAGPAVWRGVAWNDLDGDGDPDLAVSRSGGVVLFRNDIIRLVAVANAVPPQKLDGEGVALIDVNGDDRPDLFVANISGPPRLYLNRGEFRFTVAEDDLAKVSAPTSGGCFADFDGDGWLDLIVVTRGTADDLLFRNEEGQFVEVLGALAGSGGDGRTCAVGDWNGDGRPDIYIGNFIDRTEAPPRRAIDRLYLNLGGFRFAGVHRGHVVNLPSMTYGATAIDWNEDGRLDLSVSHDGRADRNVLYENRSAGGTDLDLYPVGDEMRLTILQRGPSKGQSWGDFDNDGDLDVFYSEGTEGLTPADTPFDAVDELYERVPDRFVRRREPAIDSPTRLGAGTAAADFDGDGDLDLVVANWGGRDGEPIQLYRNIAAGRSITIRLRARGANSQGIGSRVALFVDRSGKRVVRHAALWPQTGYGSMSEPKFHFGLGQIDRPTAVEILWPDGQRQLVAVTDEQSIVVHQAP